jgi:hypothetical protein
MAALYFLVDVVLFVLAKPVLRWLADCWVFESVRAWIVSLGPYPTLALFIVPVILLEPVKPVAAYLTATGYFVEGLIVLVFGELLKFLLIERLFKLSREKLMSIPAFAWCYDKFCQAQGWVASLGAWQLARRLSVLAQHAIKNYVLEFKTAQKQKRLFLRARLVPVREPVAVLGLDGTAQLFTPVIQLDARARPGARTKG